MHRISIVVPAILSILVSLPGCSQDNGITPPQETISASSRPLGSDSTSAGRVESYSTGGSSSNYKHDLQYQFNWGDGSVSDWSYSPNDSNVWSSEGGYSIKARARCATHNDVISSWSSGRIVFVGEAVSTPDIPAGISNIDINVITTYQTDHAVSSLGHNLEYRFNWNDGNTSAWSSTPVDSHSWAVEGDYNVKAQARCSVHSNRISSWSGALLVAVGETIITPSSPQGHTFVTEDRIEIYCTESTTSSRGHPILYQFDWEENAIPLWTSASCVSISWPNVGLFNLKVRARCAIHPEITSQWSGPTSIEITDHEVIATPGQPSGSSTVLINTVESYSTTGAYSSSGHNILYQFDWADGTVSPWSGTGQASHSWPIEGSYIIRVQARCAIHSARISSWSTGLVVTVMGP